MCDEKQELIKLFGDDYKKVIGDYNDYPPNMKEITLKEFVQGKFFIYDGIKEFRQPHKDSQYQGSIRIFWFYDKTGIILKENFWEGTIQYFECAVCEHQYTEKSIGNCLHEYTCIKCGFKHEVDSSD
jgi:hypothetical protein